MTEEGKVGKTGRRAGITKRGHRSCRIIKPIEGRAKKVRPLPTLSFKADTFVPLERGAITSAKHPSATHLT